MPLAADQDVGVRDGAARLGAEPVQPVRTDADDGEPVHDGSTKRALTAAAAMALPPLRPRNVTQGTSRSARSGLACFHRTDEPHREGQDRRRPFGPAA